MGAYAPTVKIRPRSCFLRVQWLMPSFRCSFLHRHQNTATGAARCCWCIEATYWERSKHPAELVVTAGVQGGVQQGPLVVDAHERRGRRGRRRPRGRRAKPREKFLELGLGRVGHQRELVPGGKKKSEQTRGPKTGKIGTQVQQSPSPIVFVQACLRRSTASALLRTTTRTLAEF